jgi:hypothetical protein
MKAHQLLIDNLAAARGSRDDNDSLAGLINPDAYCWSASHLDLNMPSKGFADACVHRQRPTDKADNKVDIAYLYYLPFCHIFVSSDNLHHRVVPEFLRKDQSFVPGPNLR